VPDVAALRSLRATRARLTAERDALGVEIRTVSDAVGTAARRADAAEVATTSTRLTELLGRRAQLTAELAATDQAIDTERDRFDPVAFPQLADRVTRLAAGVPVALLPVRIETRFLPPTSAPTHLWVRVYPDDVHVDVHEPALTDAEIVAAQQYWQARADAADDNTAIDAAWTALAGRFDAPRAEWIVRATRPGPDGAPRLDGISRKDGPWTRAAVARALPDRFVALGYAGGQRVFAEWGAPVADRVAVGHEPAVDADDTAESLAAPPAEQTDDVLDEGMRWLADLDAAQRMGMAIPIPLQPEFARGVDRLVVLGVRWSDDPDDGAALLGELLQAQRYTDGIAVLRPDAPTNNTPSVRAHFTTARSTRDPRLGTREPTQPGDRSPVGDAVVAALGIEDTTLADVEGADRVDCLGELHAALWPATLGYYGEQLLAPLLTDDVVDELHAHFVAHVRGRGPLPALRIGDQPYGLLPVVAPGRQTVDATDFESRLGRFLQRVRGFWQGALGRVPRLGRSGVPATDLVEILGMTATTQSLVGRPVLGVQLMQNLFISGMPSPVPEQSMTAQRAVGEMLFDAIGVADRSARLLQIAAIDTSYPLVRPFVQAGELSETDPPDPDFVRAILDGVGHADTLARFRQFPPPGALLEVFLRHAALVTMGNVASRLNLVARGVERRVVLEHELVDVDTAAGDMSTPLRLIDRAVEGITGGLTVAEIIATTPPELGEHVGSWEDFHAGLQGLVDVPAAELHRLFVDALDVLSHRYDAWCTSLAWRRLQTQRSRQPNGIHVGAYGFVEEVRPNITVIGGFAGDIIVDATRASAGHVHAPSLSHASTAAVLRSGFLAHGGSADDVLAVDLSSARVRRALDIIHGVRQGERLAAVLGYRVERMLRERRLGQYVLRLRAAAPLTVDAGAATDVGAAAVSGSVVDGEALVELAAQGRLFGADGQPFPGDDPHRPAVEAVIAEAADAVDALADVLLAESVHQLVRGDTASASAAMAAIDEGATPPEPDVVRTPHGGVGLTHRIAVVLAAPGGPAAGWAATRDRPRARAEPSLDRWAGQLFGPPDRIRVHAAAPDETGNEVVWSFTLAEVGIAAADVVGGMGRGTHGEASELEARLVRHARAVRPTGVPTSAVPTLLGADPGLTSSGEIELEELLLLAEQVSRVVSSARPLTAADLSSPDDGPAATGIDVAALRDRADAVATELRDAVQALRSAGDVPAFVTALETLADLAVPGCVLAGDEPGDVVRVRADAALGVAESRLAAVEAIVVAEAGASDDDVAAAHRQRLETAFGGTLRVLPDVRAGNPTELAASRAQSVNLQGGDPTQAAGWLARSGLVRDGAERLARLLLLAETLAGIAVEAVRVVQLPHVDGARWIGLDLTDDAIPASSTAFVLHDPDAVDFAAPLCGLVVDDWTEILPRGSEITGLAFNVDQPDATAPNAVVLGVHPGDRETWDLDTLEATVVECLDLAKLRAVDTDDLQWVGRFLPMLYFPDNLAGDTAAVDWTVMATFQDG
jgi:hypothetical protein